MTAVLRVGFILNKFSDSELPSVKVAFDFLLQEYPGAATCWSEERQLEQELQEAGVRGQISGRNSAMSKIKIHESIETPCATPSFRSKGAWVL